MDPFERLLTSLVEHMMLAWQLEPDRAHPLGELAAEAAAVLQFYKEREPRPSPKVSGRGVPLLGITPKWREGNKVAGPEWQRDDTYEHWSDKWKREHE